MIDSIERKKKKKKEKERKRNRVLLLLLLLLTIKIFYCQDVIEPMQFVECNSTLGVFESTLSSQCALSALRFDSPNVVARVSSRPNIALSERRCRRPESSDDEANRCAPRLLAAMLCSAEARIVGFETRVLFPDLQK
jgi:hypothetical protein